MPRELLGSIAALAQGAFERDSGLSGGKRYRWQHRGIEAKLENGGKITVVLPNLRHFQIGFPGADSRSEPSPERPLSSPVFYFLGSLRDGRSRKLWSAIRYRNLYPGIDLVLLGSADGLEYNFEFQPHADPSLIHIQYSGASLRLNSAGALEIALRGGKILQGPPLTSQGAGATRREVRCGYQVSGATVTLLLDRYDRNEGLLVDPILSFGTYLGGTSFDSVNAAATDSAGNLYLAGETSSGDLPNGSLPFRSNRDAWVAKLNSAGTQIAYLVYLGGNGNDSARGIAVDAAGNAYVTGLTASSNFPTTSGAFSTHNSGAQEAFVVELSPVGQIKYSTYLGGSGSDAGMAIAVDSTGAAYIAGLATSGNFPVTSGAFEISLHGGFSDCFVTKLNPAGNALVYSTFLGGRALDLCAGIAVDATGNAYTTGTTSSTDFPLHAPLQSSFLGSSAAFITEINPSGSALVYSTLLGGSSADIGGAIAVDSTGAAYVAGSAGSSDFPTTSGVLQSTLNGTRNAFVAKLSPGGGSLLYSTFLGGSASDSASAIAVDNLGQALIAGSTSSANFPLTNAFQPAFGGYSDAFGAVLNASGTGLVFSSYFGGAGDDRAFAVAALPGLQIFLAGMTASNNFPTASALQSSGAGNYDGFALSTAYSGAAPAAQFFVPLPPCRIVDTRTGFGFSGAFGPPSLVANATRQIPVLSSSCGIPVTAEAYSLNITAVPQGPLGFITVWPGGSSMPAGSTLDSPGGVVVANSAIIAGGLSGAISVFASNNTDVLMDINGYFTTTVTSQDLAFYPLTPCRIADTRTGFGFSGAFGPPSLVGGAARAFPAQQSPCGIPSTVEAYSLRVTTVAPGPLGYLTMWPSGQTMPVVSTLNAPQGSVVGNAAIVPAGTGAGEPISAFASNNTDLIIDTNGYFAPAGSPGALHFYALPGCRIADTRTGFGFSGSFGPPSLAAGGTRTFPLASSSCAIPANAQAYVLNLTAVVPSGGTLIFLEAYPAGQPLPNASSLNAPKGGVVASAAIVPAGTAGAINIYSSNVTDIIIDINGYFGP